MSTEKDSDIGPAYFEQLSDYSNPDLRLAPEYAAIEEDYRKIHSFSEAVKTLRDSDTSYHPGARAAGTAWPQAYEAYVSMEESLEDIPEKITAEKVMNSGFQNFEETDGEVATRHRELKNAINEAKKTYEKAAASLASEINSAALRGQRTPLDYAEEVSSSEAFDERAEELEKNVIRPENSLGELARRVLDPTGPS